MADTDTLSPPVAKPDKPPVKEAPKPDAPPIDYDRVSQSLGLGPMQRTLAEDRAKVDALAPGPPRLTPPPTVPPPTDPFQAFGQPAMWLATFGSLLTRHHLTSAIQSAGAVLDSVHKQDDEAVKRAMAEWKINSENAQKMAAYELNAYRAALSHQSNDIREAQAKITTLNHAFQNAVYTEAFNKGGISEVAKLVKKGSADEVLLQERRLRLDADLEKRAAEGTLRKTWKAANPNATQQQIASADLMISQGKDPTELMTKDFGPPQEIEVTGEGGQKTKLLAQQDKRSGQWLTADENRTPIHASAGTFRVVKEGTEKPTQPEAANALESWKSANPEAARNPMALNAAAHTIQSGGVPNEQGLPLAKPTAEKPPSAAAAAEKDAEIIAAANLARKNFSADGILTPEQDKALADEPAARARVAARGEAAGIKTADTTMAREVNRKAAPGSPARERSDRFEELKKAAEASGLPQDDTSIWDKVDQQMIAIKENHISPAAAKIIVEQAIAGDYSGLLGWGRSPGIRKDLENALAEELATRHLSGADLARLKANYAAYTQGVKSFAPGGQMEKPTRSLSVAVDHLDLLQEAATALAQHDQRALNALQNIMEREIEGWKGPVVFDALRNIVSAEIEKAVTGGAGAVADREDLKSNLNKSLSPEALRSVIQAYEGLMGGQLNGIRSSYQRLQRIEGQTGDDFDRDFLTPRARQVLTGKKASDDTPPPSYPDAKKAPDGHWYIQKNGAYFKVKE